MPPVDECTCLLRVICPERVGHRQARHACAAQLPRFLFGDPDAGGFGYPGRARYDREGADERTPLLSDRLMRGTQARGDWNFGPPPPDADTLIGLNGTLAAAQPPSAGRAYAQPPVRSALRVEPDDANLALVQFSDQEVRANILLVSDDEDGWVAQNPFWSSPVSRSAFLVE